jgi:hypothetical protein
MVFLFKIRLEFAKSFQLRSLESDFMTVQQAVRELLRRDKHTAWHGAAHKSTSATFPGERSKN